MVQQKLATEKLFLSLEEAAAAFVQRVYSFTETELNTVPRKGSWTAAQVADHVTRSNHSIARSLTVPGKPIDREPDKRVSELRDTFLDFSIRLQSPDFILPTRDRYQKDILLVDLERSAGLLRQSAQEVELAEALTHPAFGEITKFEIVYFSVYHTRRHHHQLETIFRSLTRLR